MPLAANISKSRVTNLDVAILALGYFAFDKFVLAPRRDAALLTQVEQARSAVAKQALASNAP